jgi:uncharacterized protein (TIGR03435 family)
MVLTKTKLAVAVGLLLLAGAAFGVKQVYFPTVDDQWFRLDYSYFQHAPAGVLILRPTHFADPRRSGCLSVSSSSAPGKNVPRLLGRDVPLDQVIAMAYQCPASRVVLPPGAPTNHFDFLVTVRDRPAERLQAAVKSKLGYTASWQERETDVLQLKVQTPNARGLHASSTDQPNINFKHGTLYFTRQPLDRLPGLLERALKKPVQDKTGLAGYYDFSLVWNWRQWRPPDETALKNSLGEMGLTLVNDSDRLSMLVVERVN